MFVLKIPSPYFKNVPNIGDLDFNYGFYYSLSRPILFTCTDKNGNFYLCSCNSTSPILEWFISKTSKKALLDMVNNEISLSDIFNQSSDKFTAVFKDGDEQEIIEKVIKFDDGFLQDKDVYLDGEDNEFVDFIQMIS